MTIVKTEKEIRDRIKDLDDLIIAKQLVTQPEIRERLSAKKEVCKWILGED